jgi:hypothetical protein
MYFVYNIGLGCSVALPQARGVRIGVEVRATILKKIVERSSFSCLVVEWLMWHVHFCVHACVYYRDLDVRVAIVKSSILWSFILSNLDV